MVQTQVTYKLNLGAGSKIKPDCVNLDIVPLPGIDVTWNLDIVPWPLPDAEADEIWAEDIFEHVTDPLLFMNECGRLLADKGLLHLRVAHWQSENAFTDPTHKRFCTERTFDYWCPLTKLGKKYPHYRAEGVAFSHVVTERDGQEMLVTLRRERSW